MIPPVAIRDNVLAAQLDSLLEAADGKLGRLYANKTWFAFDLTDTPQQQIPPAGAVYVLTPDAERVILPPPSTPGAPDGNPWPNQYVHADHLAAVNALTITGLDTLGIAWQVDDFYSTGGYNAGEAASVMERTHTDPVAGTRTLPVRYPDAYEPERFHRYALADVFIESTSATTFSWPHDKYGVVRLHNLSKIGIVVNLTGESFVGLAPMEIRCVRRLSRDNFVPWITDVRRYFPKCEPLDIPVWDGTYTGGRPIKSQAANPIFRVALVQSMFRPQELTDGAGLFAASVNDISPVLDTNTLADVLVQKGKFDIIRTVGGSLTGDAAYYQTDVFSFDWTGQVPDGTTELETQLEEVGLLLTVEEASRGLRLTTNPAFPPYDPDHPSWVWQYDLVSRGTNLSGGIISRANSRVLLPWFADALQVDGNGADAADQWFAGLFHWQTYSVVKTSVQHYWRNGIWTPSPTGADPDYHGSWAQDGPDHEEREWTGRWGGTTTISTIAPWNLFTTTVATAKALVEDSDRDQVKVVVHPILTAVLCDESVPWWSPDDDPTWDNATAVAPRDPGPGNPDGGPSFYVAGKPIGLGTHDADNWTEPKWRVLLNPTIGVNPTTSWLILAQHGTEENIWTPIYRESEGGAVQQHWRVKGGEGVAGGGPWTWNYEASGERTLPAGVPEGEVASGQQFWRVFALSTTDLVPKTGPQPWRIADHGWLADQILAENPNIGWEPWSRARVDLWDHVPLGGAEGGELRPVESEIAVQVRMTAATFNGVAALVDGMTHVRPLGFERYAYGFPFSSLRLGAEGWFIGFGPNAQAFTLKPWGAAHIYGADTNLDGILDGLGITRRMASSAELQVLKTIEMRQYAEDFSGLITDEPGGTRPIGWTTAGDEIEYCTSDDLHAALSAIGFAFNFARLVQAVNLQTFIPGPGIETETDTTTAFGLPAVKSRLKIPQTIAIPIPETGSSPTLQVNNTAHFHMAPERPMRAAIIMRKVGDTTPIPVSVRRVGPASGPVADALDRFLGGEWNSSGSIGVGSSPFTWWEATLQARTGLTVEVMAIPWRRLLSSLRAPDDSGPRAVTDTEWTSPLVLPNDTARPKWFTVAAGGKITLGELGGAAPAYPDGHHVWELQIMPADIEAL